MSMSIQSDVEILSVQALEQYAKQHNLPTAEAVSLFYKHQVFEKILIQHEYLHQLDLEETLNYVEEIIAENAPELVIYHGSNFAFDTIDLENPTTAVTLVGDFTVPSWKARQRNGPDGCICAPTKAADTFTVTCSGRQRT